MPNFCNSTKGELSELEEQMDIQITVETGGYQVLSSGTLMTIENQPIVMTAVISEEQTVSVALYLHQEKHPAGKGLVRGISIDGTVDEWHIYESDDGDGGQTISPVPIIQYEVDDEVLTLYLQVHTQKLSPEGTFKFDYCLLEGKDESSVEVVGR
jgi:hypothetical protein